MITWLLLGMKLPSIFLGLFADGILFSSLLRLYLNLAHGAGKRFIGELCGVGIANEGKI